VALGGKKKEKEKTRPFLFKLYFRGRVKKRGQSALGFVTGKGSGTGKEIFTSMFIPWGKKRNHAFIRLPL